MRSKLITALVLGINSGLVYALLGSTFSAYLKDFNIELAAIGLLSLRMIPYSFKYLWSPAVDVLPLGGLSWAKRIGQRKSWLLTMQAGLVILIASMGFINPNTQLTLLCILAFIAAFLSATYDIAMEAFRIELFEQSENKEFGYGLVVTGFRVGLIVSGALGLYLSALMPWKWVFFLIAGSIIPCMALVALSKDDKKPTEEYNFGNFGSFLKKECWGAFTNLMEHKFIWFILPVIACYKITDGFLDAMLLPYLLEVGYSKALIASYAKTVGIGAALLGTGAGVLLLRNQGLLRNLFFAETMAAGTNLLFLLILKWGALPSLLLVVNFAESFCSGVANIVFIQFMSSLVNLRYTASQFALFISISSLSRTLLSSISGYTAQYLGWSEFFIISSMLSVPALVGIIALAIKSEHLVLSKKKVVQL